MRAISVLNMKGGVGKTTLAVNLAYALAYQHNKRVLLVDTDPQFNATTSLMSNVDYRARLESNDKKTILDIYRPTQENMSMVAIKQAKRDVGDINLDDIVHSVHSDLHGKLDLIPSNLLLIEMRSTQYGVENKLNNFLKEKAKGYDYVFLDCPPTISFHTTAAVLASTDYLIPVKPDPLSIIGLPLVERWLREFSKDANLTLNFIGIVLCMVQNPQPNQVKAVIKQVRDEYPGKVFATALRQGTHAPKATAANSPILSCHPTSGVAKDINEIAKEFLIRVEGQ